MIGGPSSPLLHSKLEITTDDSSFHAHAIVIVIASGSHPSALLSRFEMDTPITDLVRLDGSLILFAEV
jgi:hypothetical protein